MTLPLSGVRIVELGQLIAIPAATKLLADMGAETIRVESCSRLELYRTISPYDNSAGGEYWNRAANFYEQNRNKLGITLDLGKPNGIEALKDLISISDVFAENFTPRVMVNFGLEYEDLRVCKPDIIMVSSTGYGYTGPWSGFGAIGYATEAASGLTHVTGYRGGPPVLPEIPYSDYPAAEHAAFAIVTALLHRARTGRGQLVDLSHAETVRLPSARGADGLHRQRPYHGAVRQRGPGDGSPRLLPLPRRRPLGRYRRLHRCRVVIAVRYSARLRMVPGPALLG